jgi:hypothetical protein
VGLRVGLVMVSFNKTPVDGSVVPKLLEVNTCIFQEFFKLSNYSYANLLSVFAI